MSKAPKLQFMSTPQGHNINSICTMITTVTTINKIMANRPCSINSINIQAWLWGLWVKIAKFSSFFCPSIPKRDLDTKKTTPNIEVCPESLGAMLEYWYIERGLSCQFNIRHTWTSIGSSTVIKRKVTLSEKMYWIWPSSSLRVVVLKKNASS